MDALTASTTFATLVSLLGDFVSRREAADSTSYEHFLFWLQGNRHEDVVAQLERNQAIAIAVKALLADTQQVILARLDGLDRALAAYASGVDAFRAMAVAMRPEAVLSTQAVDLIRQFHASGATRLLEHRLQSGPTLLFLDAAHHTKPVFEEPRFIEDDLTSLVRWGLLELEYTPRGSRLFKFTRAAARMADATGTTPS